MLDDQLLSSTRPASELVVETTKAKIYRTPDGRVVKQYLAEDAAQRASQDAHSLTYLQTHFGEVQLDGWRYFMPNFFGLGVDGQSFEMEYVSGLPLSKTSRLEIGEAEYHSGIWLAHYHNRIVGDSNYGLIFSDYNVHNILVDTERKQIAAIDPGGLWGKENNAYEDIIHHTFSLLVVLILKGRAPFRALFCFLDGYVENRDRSFEISTYLLGVRGAFRWKQRRFGKKSTQERVSFYAMLVVFLVPLYLLIVPSYILLRQKRVS